MTYVDRHSWPHEFLDADLSRTLCHGAPAERRRRIRGSNRKVRVVVYRSTKSYGSALLRELTPPAASSHPSTSPDPLSAERDLPMCLPRSPASSAPSRS